MDSNHILKNAEEICKNFNQGSEVVKLEVCKDANKLSDFYKTYKGVKEFLYIAPKEEIEEAISKGAIYFVVNYEGNMAGVAKASKLELPYPFFCVPKTMDPTKDYWGLSGLYVHKNFQGKKLSTVLLKSTTALAEKCKANGIYADFDYRNVNSMNLVSRYYSLLGYTDGREGAPDEATIYTTFFKDFTNSSEHAQPLYVIFEQIDCGNARATLDAAMEKFGNSTIRIVPYCGGHNEVVCFDKPYTFELSSIKVLRDITKEKEIKNEKKVDTIK